MTKYEEIEWPPKNWSLELSGKAQLMFLAILMFLYFPHWLNYTILVIGAIVGSMNLYLFFLRKETKRLEAKKTQLLKERQELNEKLFAKFGNYSNSYGYKDGRNV